MYTQKDRQTLGCASWDYFSSKVFQCFSIFWLHLEKEKNTKRSHIKAISYIKMYRKSHCNTNSRMLSSPMSIPAPLSGTSFTFALLRSLVSHSSVCYDRRVHVHDHLDHKVLLDLGVLQSGLVSQELPRKEPPLASNVDVFLFFQLLL